MEFRVKHFEYNMSGLEKYVAAVLFSDKVTLN